MGYRLITDDEREILEKCHFHHLECNKASMLALYQLLTNVFSGLTVMFKVKGVITLNSYSS